MSVCRQDKFQVLQFHSTMKIIRLMVEVTNFPGPGKLAEDAHQAELNVTIPDALKYSGVRSEVRPLEGSRRLANVHFQSFPHAVLNYTVRFFFLFVSNM